MTESAAPRRTDLLTSTLADAPAIDHLQCTRIELAPGQIPGAHHHPCDVVGTVLSGSIRFQIADDVEQVLHAGDAFFEPRDTLVTHFDNTSDEYTAVFWACYLLGPTQTELIVMNPPPTDTPHHAR